MTEAEMVKCIVKCKQGIQSCEDIVTTMGATVIRTHASIDAMTISISKDKADELKKNPNMEYVEVTTPEDVHVLGFKGDLKVEAILKTLQSSQQVPWGITKIRATNVQAGGNKGTGIRVCILDTGIDYNHEDLLGQMRIGHNFVTGTDDPFDNYGHGSHVAGTIAALDNDVGVIGVAPECSLLIGKVLDQNGSGSYDWIVAGIQWAIDHKAQVISMSFGGGSFSQALKDACDAAKKAGIVLVAAAGNADGDGSQDTVGYPAKFDSVIAVASTDSNDNRSSFSSAGPEVWVAAPGSNVLSTVPKGSCQLCDPSGYKYLNGTSMATPHVSATVALMLKASPNLSPDNVQTLLSTTSIDLGPPGRDVFFGYGRIDAVNAVGENPPPPPVLSSISIPSSATIQIGQTVTLTAICKDANNNTITCPTLTWTSDNTSIASVNQSGVVTGNTQGTANINCSNSDKAIISNICNVTVTPQSTPPPTPPPSNKKYHVQQIGNLGVVVTVTPFDGVDVNTACQQTCTILKNIDSK